jgi:hypothetical protein
MTIPHPPYKALDNTRIACYTIFTSPAVTYIVGGNERGACLREVNEASVQTGRFSSKEPNLSNVPKTRYIPRGERVRLMLERDGYLTVDQGKIEERLAAQQPELFKTEI